MNIFAADARDSGASFYGLLRLLVEQPSIMEWVGCRQDDLERGRPSGAAMHPVDPVAS